jgi:sterol 3beta-glucosyltransferase
MAGVNIHSSHIFHPLFTLQFRLGRVINDFRTDKLGLQSLTVRSGPGVVDRLKIPWTYCFSPEIVPKPDDWQNHIDVVGFYFLNLASGYQPPPDLAAFLAAGPPPIYIG